MNSGLSRNWRLPVLFAGFFLALRYLLPLAFPFLLGLALALAAEPIVRFFCGKCRFPRPLSSALGVTMAFCLLTLAVMLVLGLMLREVRALIDKYNPRCLLQVDGGMYI